MSALSIPDVRVRTILAGATANVNFSEKLGRVHMRVVNTGAVPTVYAKFDGIPGAAPADGQFTLDSLVPGYDADDIEFTSVGFYAVTDCRVEVIGYRSVQGMVMR